MKTRTAYTLTALKAFGIVTALAFALALGFGLIPLILAIVLTRATITGNY